MIAARDWELWSTELPPRRDRRRPAPRGRRDRRRPARRRRPGLQPLSARQRAAHARPRRRRLEPSSARRSPTSLRRRPRRRQVHRRRGRPDRRRDTLVDLGYDATSRPCGHRTAPVRADDPPTGRVAQPPPRGQGRRVSRLWMPAGTQLDLGATAKARAADLVRSCRRRRARHRRAGQPRRRHRHRRHRPGRRLAGHGPGPADDRRTTDHPDRRSGRATSSTARRTWRQRQHADAPPGRPDDAPGPRTGPGAAPPSSPRPACRRTPCRRPRWSTATVPSPGSPCRHCRPAWSSHDGLGGDPERVAPGGGGMNIAHSRTHSGPSGAAAASRPWSILTVSARPRHRRPLGSRAASDWGASASTSCTGPPR